MKPFVFVCFFVFIATGSFAQDVTLTKGETVAYIEKKFKEAEGAHSDFSKNGTNSRYRNLRLSFKDNNLIMEYTYDYTQGGNWVWGSDRTITFNPLYIKSVSTGSTLSDIQTVWIDLSLPGKDRQRNSNGSFDNNINGVQMFYLGTSTDKSNGEKIKKALLHLQALLKAEDDPFAK
jgi:hypothetical protein